MDKKNRWLITLISNIDYSVLSSYISIYLRIHGNKKTTRGKLIVSEILLHACVSTKEFMDSTASMTGEITFP